MVDSCSLMEVIPTSVGGVEVTNIVIYRHLTSEPITSAEVGDIVDVATTVYNSGSSIAVFQCGVFVNGVSWYVFGHNAFPAGSTYTDKQYYTVSQPVDLTVCADIIS